MISRIRKLIEGSDTILITTHVNPDGDGIGSGLALYRQLREAGKQIRLVTNDPIPERYRFLDPDAAGEVFDAGRDAEFIRDCDLIFVLDNSSMGRMGPMAAALDSSSATKVCIDHHVIRAEPGREPADGHWDVLWNREEAAATGELIFDLIEALGGPWTLPKAEALYVSLVTDTGNFRFSKTGPRSHQMAARLLQCGVSPVRVYQEVFERNSMAFMRLLGHILTQFQQECGGRFVWAQVDRRRIEAFGAEDEDTSEMVNFLFLIHRVEMAILFKELAGGQTKVSLRSKGDLDVNALAVRFGGGGHRNASGIVLEEPLASGTDRILAEARRMF